MTCRVRTQTVIVALLACGAVATAAARQTTSARAADTPNISGSWVLNRDVSDDPTKASLEPPAPEKGAQRDGGRMSGGIGGISIGGFGGGRGHHSSGGRPESGRTDNRPDAESSRALTAGEKTLLRELTEYVRSGSAMLSIADDTRTLAITDSRHRIETLPTDGSRAHLQLLTASVDSSTYWEGSELVTEYTIGPGLHIVRTLTLVPASRQLVMRFSIEDGSRRSGRTGARGIKLVYNAAPAQ